MEIFGIEIKDLALIVTGAISIASVIVKLTKNPKDDNVLKKVRNILKLIGLYKKDD